MIKNNVNKADVPTNWVDSDIHNFYEKLVKEHIIELGLHKTRDANFLSDVACLALNKLPPRYIRYNVDMAFYLPDSERSHMRLNVINAVQESVSFLEDQSKVAE